ncbi:hypothetical protein BSKO_00773 [Bryopsis sp. KO-2023]|nr:hypothetical protein BSKO_00773 [Bryopsis sp. KO-2023]
MHGAELTEATAQNSGDDIIQALESSCPRGNKIFENKTGYAATSALGEKNKEDASIIARDRVSLEEIPDVSMLCGTGSDRCTVDAVLGISAGEPTITDVTETFHSFLRGRTHSDGALGRASEVAYSGERDGVRGRDFRVSERLAAEGCSSRINGDVPKVPVFVMLPLDTVNAAGVFQYASTQWFTRALDYLAASGVTGVAVDVWWGAVERQPGVYEWSGYGDLFELLKSIGLKLQVVLSFHACGGNVGDIAQIPLPQWVLEAGKSDPDLFFADKPRNHRPGQRNQECISLFADGAQNVLCGRSPLQCYEDFATAFRDRFYDDLGTFVTEVVVGCGPCGELRYPSYVEGNGWRFPGVGEFQCYDRRALVSLARAAKAAGHPEWGYGGPHDSGTYNCSAEATPFFRDGGSWETPYGQFFLKWYSDSLLQHGDRMLTMARKVFMNKLSPKRGEEPPAPVMRPSAIFETLNSWVDKGDVVFAAKPASSTSFTDICVNSGNRSLSRGTGSSLSVRQVRSPGSLSTALPSTQSMDTLDMVAVGCDAADDNECEYAERPGGPASPSDMCPPDVNDSMECIVARVSGEQGGSSSSPSSGSDLVSLVNGEGQRGEEALGSGSLEKSNSEQRWSFLNCFMGFLDGRPRAAPGIDLRIKIPGVHWWYQSQSHAAELTAGYFNTEHHCGYKGVVELCWKHGANLTLTCVEMCDAQHPMEARCSPQGLLRQIWAGAADYGVELSGENALPLFTPGGSGADSAAFERIVKHARDRGARVGHHHACNSDWKDGRGSVNPVMGSFTFLRLGPEILDPHNQGLWMRFMHGMQS